MSYILDALRRAEAERERGAVPGLHSQPNAALTPTATASRRTAWIVGGAALAVLAAAAGGWWFAGSRSTAAEAPRLVGAPAPAVRDAAPDNTVPPPPAPQPAVTAGAA
ncbi:hypothetical protein CKO43_17155, partial [Rubrivivax gelatinosus]|nr:hypothetical protein [Rubrivivax gelatinosus]